MAKDDNRGCLGFFFPSPRVKPKGIYVEDLPGDDTDIIYPYEVSRNFLSRAEHSFYLVAKQLLGEAYILCPQVSLSAIFTVISPDDFYSAFNRISKKRIDFVVCDADTMKIRFGIELDDSSHQRDDRKQRDEFVNKVFLAANLPLIRVKTRNSYNSHDLQEKFNQVLNITVQNFALKEPIQENPFLPEVGVNEVPSEPIKNPECCPNCGSPMKIRTSLAGPNVGHQFYVCIRYPECKTTIKID